MVVTYPSVAQQSLEDFPGYDKYRAVQEASRELAREGRISRVEWAADESTVTFRRGDDRVTFDLTNRVEIDPADEVDDDNAGARPDRRSRAGERPGRGRQRGSESSPNGRWTATCRDWNAVLVDNESEETKQITTDGWRKFRYGTASWVYGEELDQQEAMWWSPDSNKLVFYEFDERDVPDHWLVTGWGELHTKAEVEGYPKPGEPNPVAGLIIYDIESGEKKRISVGEDVEQYIYGVRFTPGGSELLFFRTNRRQNVLDLVAADMNTGETRVVLTETQDTWQENRPEVWFLDDGERFIWQTERTGWKNYELRNLQGETINSLTSGDHPCDGIERVDEKRAELWYTAFSDDNHLNAQVHRVSLDGANQTKLTQRSMNYTSVNVSPSGNWFITTFESVDTPASTVLCDRDGNEIAVLNETPATKITEAKITLPELFTCKAADGETTIYGILYKPADFDPEQNYPILIDVYGGPYSQSVRNRFSGARAECEFGWLIAEIDNRGTTNRGKAFESASYLKLGDVDIADQVEAVRYLTSRLYIDETRVAIAGSSYGGYMAALAILKFPDVYHVAIAGSSVTDWRQYDTIYTERYMRTPAENESGYVAGSCMTYADQLRGHLLMQHGLLDNNVHANNTFALVKTIREAGGVVDVIIHHDRGHSLGMDAFHNRLRYLRNHLLDGDGEDDADKAESVQEPVLEAQ